MQESGAREQRLGIVSQCQPRKITNMSLVRGYKTHCKVTGDLKRKFLFGEYEWHC